MIKQAYYWLHKKISKPEERGEYSAGHWQNLIRENFLAKSKDRQGSLLEVGCGEGLFLSALYNKNSSLRIVGVDIWQKIIDRAQARFDELGIKSVLLKRGDGKSLPFSDEEFDTVVCMNVLFNLPNEDVCRQVIQENLRVCKKDGRIIFDIRNKANPILWIKYKLAPFYDETVKELPLNTYHLKPMLKFVESLGCEIKDIVKVGFPQNMFAPLFIIEAEKK